jgi:hypothetical protein
MFRKNVWVTCINAEGIELPNFELIKGNVYLVVDVKVKPGLLSRDTLKLVFQANDSSLVEINSKRFQLASIEVKE